MSTPDLQPTQRIPTLPSDSAHDPDVLVPQRRGPNVAGFVLRLLLILLLAIGAMMAVFLGSVENVLSALAPNR